MPQLGLSLVLWGCHSPQPTTGIPQVQATNLVLIQVDTLRADRLSMTGDRDTTPKLAERDWLSIGPTFATAGWTVPATASVLTGQPPHGHQLVNLKRDGDGLVPNGAIMAPTIPSALQDRGFATGLFTGNPFLTGSGFEEGFDTVVLQYEDLASSNMNKLLPDVRAWLDDVDDSPFFMMLQPLDPHQAYSPSKSDLGTWADLGLLGFDPLVDQPSGEDLGELQRQAVDPEATTQAISDLYDEQLLGLDRALHLLLEDLEERGVIDDTLVVLTADHGETLGEGGSSFFGHGAETPEETVRVPHLWHHPTLETGEFACLGSGIDVLPTALAAMGVALDLDTEGVPLQTGCRETTLSSHYGGPGRLVEIRAQNTEVQLEWRCDGDATLWQLGSERAALGTHPDQGVLEQAIDQHLTQAQGVWPDLACAVE